MSTKCPPARRPWASDIAREYLSDAAATGVSCEDLATAARVMRAIAATELRDLERMITTDSLGNPITDTPEQKRAQATWSQAYELTDRARGWANMLDLAIERTNATADEPPQAAPQQH